jgi:hypothetical protein
MITPKTIDTLKKGSVYEVPVYRMTNDGIVVGGKTSITFINGDRIDDMVPRVDGLIPETVLACLIKNIVETSVPGLEKVTDHAVALLNDSLMILSQRASMLKDIEQTAVQQKLEKEAKAKHDAEQRAIAEAEEKRIREEAEAKRLAEEEQETDSVDLPKNEGDE